MMIPPKFTPSQTFDGPGLCPTSAEHFIVFGGVAEWLTRSVSNHTRSTRVGSNPVVGATGHKPTVNSAVHPSEVVK